MTVYGFKTIRNVLFLAQLGTFLGSGWGRAPAKVIIDQESFEPNPRGCCVRRWGIYECLWLQNYP